MNWEEIEEHLRAQGRSESAIAYARMRYSKEDEYEYSGLVRYTFEEIALAYDVGKAGTKKRV